MFAGKKPYVPHPPPPTSRNIGFGSRNIQSLQSLLLHHQQARDAIGFQKHMFQDSHFGVVVAFVDKSIVGNSVLHLFGISRPRPKSRSRKLPGSYFKAFPGPGPKTVSEGFQEVIFKHFQAQAQKSFQKPSRKLFSRISRPRPKSRSRRLPGSYF